MAAVPQLNEVKRLIAVHIAVDETQPIAALAYPRNNIVGAMALKAAMRHALCAKGVEHQFLPGQIGHLNRLVLFFNSSLEALPVVQQVLEEAGLWPNSAQIGWAHAEESDIESVEHAEVFWVHFPPEHKLSPDLNGTIGTSELIFERQRIEKENARMIFKVIAADEARRQLERKAQMDQSEPPEDAGGPK